MWINGEPAVQVADVARTASRTYGSLKRYVERDVLPPLVDRGLFEVQAKRFLVIFSTTRYVRTTAGQAAQAELDRWLAAGQIHFAGWVGDDPAQALAYAGAPGAALLLMPPLFPKLRQLRQQTPLSSIDDDDGGGGGVSSVLNNGMSIMGLGTDYQQLIKGLVLLLAVAFDIFNKNRSGGDSWIGKQIKSTRRSTDQTQESRPAPPVPAPAASSVRPDAFVASGRWLLRRR